MLYRKIGKTDMNASVIALGTWAMGGWMWGGSNDLESIKAVHASLDAGINFIDTAPIYGFGRSEEIVGRAIKGRREKVIVATKCGLVWEGEKGNFYFYSDDKGVTKEAASKKVYKYLGAESIIQEVEKSLRRLQTDYIDLYQTHWQETTTPIEETMKALLKLKDDGKIRAIGVCNASVEQLKQYGSIDSDQEKYSMLIRKIEKEKNTFYCDNNKIALLAYSPLAQGLLTGKFNKGHNFKPGDTRNNNSLFKCEYIQNVNAMLYKLKPVAESYEITLGQLVLAWTYNQHGITHLLCGARNPKQAIENAKTGEIKLEQNDIGMIDQIYSEHFKNA